MSGSGQQEPVRRDGNVDIEPDDLVSEFLIESQENLDRLDRDLIDLEKNPPANDLLASIFRTVHTLKATSDFLAFSKLQAVAHAGETLLGNVRDHKLRLNTEMTSTLFAMVDCIRDILASIEQTRQEGDNDVAALISQMHALAIPSVTGGVACTTSGANVVASREPSFPCCDDDGSKPIGQLLVEHAGVEPTAVEAAREMQRLGDLRTMGEILVSQGAVSPSAARAVIAYQQESRSASMNDTCVRVEVALLDKLISLTAELVLVRNHIVQGFSPAKEPVWSEDLRHLTLITAELQREATKARMQPIGILWSRMPRILRDLALARGKRVRVEMHGADIKLDRRLLEAIKGPLTHLVRNAIDHGIEPVPQRLALGKPPEGCVTLRAWEQDGQVNVEVDDDGAGINLDLVKQRALAQGLIAADGATLMSGYDAANLVFLPGLTTADRVTTVSGRGVGMDVVKTNMENIGGSVDLQTRPGKGTTVTLKIPVTAGQHTGLTAESAP